MAKSKTILIVDDSGINRAILRKIISSEYNVCEAGNGVEALKILNEKQTTISGILLDLVMPEMDGYEVLRRLSADDELSNIPVIVSTGNSDKEYEKKALELGAWDFVTKPFDADIIKFRLKNAIDRSRLTFLEQLQYIADFDALTGIYSKNKFFEETKNLIDSHPDDEFVFVRFDIDKFSLINSFYGLKAGDGLLKFIAELIKSLAQKYGMTTYGRIDADIFGICMKHYSMENAEKIVAGHMEMIKAYNSNYNIQPTTGIYVIEDRSLTASAMYDRATMASKTIKGDCMKYLAFYNDKMRVQLETAQEVSNEMEYALEDEQFVVYLQPKYDIRINKPAGAEALVRWKHPQKGLVSPGLFIPVFESNGFISKLDFYMWDKVCKLIRSWIDRKMPVYPISVNVSRVNMYNPKLVDIIVELVEKYDIPPKYLNLELTESAYTDKDAFIDETLSALQSKGFSIFMDDFGSGYSSLNVLKDISVDVLKIDMKFMSKAKKEGRAENIIASVVRMAKWLNMPVIAEGVEEKEQVEFLRGIGCEYVQGYYFAKPMPVSDYEELISNSETFKEPENNNAFDNVMLDGVNKLEPALEAIAQPAIIFEFNNNGLDVLFENTVFSNSFGYHLISNVNNEIDYLSSESQNIIFTAILKAIKTKGTVECEYERNPSGKNEQWFNLKIKYLGQSGQGSILVGSFTDITDIKSLDTKLEQIKKYQETLAHIGSEKNTVLIVDDDNFNRVVLNSILEEKFKIIEVENGVQALDIMEKEKIDIILLDLNMPVMNGEEFLEKRKSIDGWENIPVVIISADDRLEKQSEVLELGADDYITKPFVQKIVANRIENLIKLKGVRDADMAVLE